MVSEISVKKPSLLYEYEREGAEYQNIDDETLKRMKNIENLTRG